MKKELVKKRVSSILILITCILFVSSFVAASDVAYIYRNSNNVDDNILNVFSDMGLSVDLIDENNLPSDFSGYRFIFVGDERFRKDYKIPIGDYPSIVSNYYFGYEWGLTDGDGISKLASNFPLSVTKDGHVVQVYTRAKYPDKSVSIPYYYLDDENKVPEMLKVAGTYIGNEYDFGDVISYAGAGTDLINGHTTDKKICFFGIVETDYWTSNARELFEDCVNYVGVTCSDDSDCGDDEYVGDEFCIGDNVYQNYKEYNCENAGKVNSDCSFDTEAKFVKECEYGCADGECLLECYEDSDCASDEICVNNECVDIACKNDLDCSDSNAYTKDSCVNPGLITSYCDYEDIVCLNDLDCDDGVFNNVDSCVNPGQTNSYCDHDDIVCFEDSDCNDGNVYTFDECENSGTSDAYCINTPINCVNNNDCGFTGFTGQEFCQQDNVFKKFQESICNNPGTKNSFCSSDISSQLVLECADVCVAGACIEINCYNNADCDDSNVYTDDVCVNPGQVDSYCDYDGVRCFSNNDCDDLNAYTIDSCVNPGSSNSYCSYDDVVCINDNDCGIDGFVGNNFCLSENVFRDYKEFDCLNPGSASSSCSQNVEQRLVEECADTCVAGACVDITCYNDLDCDDGNSGTSDSCVNPGQTNSYCTHGDIDCFLNSDCGSNQYVSNNYCSGNNVYRDLRIFMCNDAGSVLSFCSDNTIPKLISECSYVCSDGLCVRCNEDSDCDDGNSGTQDICRFAGTLESYCDNENIECSEDSDCGEDGFIGEGVCKNGDVYQNYEEFSCDNAGSVGSSCSSDISLRLVVECDYGCSDGECVFLTECQDGYDNDADFLIDAQDPGCWNDVGNPLTYNPLLDDESRATTQCQDDLDNDGDLLIDEQDPGCWRDLSDPSTYNPLDNDEDFGGVVCYTNADCDDSDDYTIDICMNPGLGTSYCGHNSIACLQDSDCGIGGFVGNGFCLGDNVYQNYKEFECINPGFANAYCSSLMSFNLIEECAEECVAGGCVDIECYNNADCVDGDDYTFDECLNPGTVESQCTHEPIDCLQDADCGDDGFIGQVYCNGNNVFDVFTEYACINPGTPDASCYENSISQLFDNCGSDYCEGYVEDYCVGDDVHHSRTCYDKGCLIGSCFSEPFVETELVEACAYACAGGECVGECSEDSDCADDYYSDNYCVGDNVYRDLHDFGCEGLSCVEDVIDELVEQCADTCVDGACVDITCYEDSDCGDDGYIGENYCSEGDVYRDYREFSCLNPGSESSFCSDEIDSRLVDACSSEQVCEEGECVDCDSDREYDTFFHQGGTQYLDMLTLTNQDLDSRYKSDTATANQVCKDLGYDGYSSIDTTRPFTSCWDNHIDYWNNGWHKIEACSSNNFIETLTCYEDVVNCGSSGCSEEVKTFSNSEIYYGSGTILPTVSCSQCNGGSCGVCCFGTADGGYYANALTAGKICELKGYDELVNWGSKSGFFTSPCNNYMYKWLGSDYSRVSAESFNTGVDWVSCSNDVC